MRNKLLCYILIGVLLISGCGTQNNDETTTLSTTQIEENNVQEAPTVEDEPPISITEQVIFDQNDIKITATGIDMEDSLMGASINLLIENNSQNDITVQARRASANGYMVSTTMSADVMKGKKANDTLIINNRSMKECGITDIAEIEFCFHIYESETMNTIIDTEMIHLDTSIAGSYTQKYDDSGEVIYEDEIVKVVSKGLNIDESWDSGLVVYMENKSDKRITLQVRDTSLNGFMIDPTFSSEIEPGKKAVSDISFMNHQLEENGISEFENMEFSFHIFLTESYDILTDTAPIVVNFK